MTDLDCARRYSIPTDKVIHWHIEREDYNPFDSCQITEFILSAILESTDGLTGHGLTFTELEATFRDFIGDKVPSNTLDSIAAIQGAYDHTFHRGIRSKPEELTGDVLAHLKASLLTKIRYTDEFNIGIEAWRRAVCVDTPKRIEYHLDYISNNNP